MKLTRFTKALALLFILLLTLTACDLGTLIPSIPTETTAGNVTTADDTTKSPQTSFVPPDGVEAPALTQAPFDLSAIPPYSGDAYVAVNDNIPSFTAAQYTNQSYEYYSPLDALGRCGTTVACIGTDLMPTDDRGSIGSVKPTGWQSVKYDIVDGKYLYNRCHLIGFQLTGENANKQNLITGTRYLNIEGMLPFENMIADYIKETGNHVLFRVTPIFVGNELVARGVHMEAYSVEDGGDGISFSVFAYNVQPGIEIDYATGLSCLSGETLPPAETTGAPTGDRTYILNTASKKFHYESCSYAVDLSEANKAVFTGSRDALIADGYEPCGRCKP